jgi:hypothetical protein
MTRPTPPGARAAEAARQKALEARPRSDSPLNEPLNDL